LNKNGESKDWVREIKPHEDPNVDPWEKEKNEKKERVAKNEHARLKNIARQRGMNNAKRQQDKNELRDSFRKAKYSTASLGNFDEAVAGEKKEKIGGKKKYNALFSKDADVSFFIEKVKTSRQLILERVKTDFGFDVGEESEIQQKRGGRQSSQF
jgi:hypothetical protein